MSLKHYQIGDPLDHAWKAVEMLSTQLAQLKSTGLTMLVAEQNVHFVSELGDRVYILEKGMVRYQGSMREFVGNEEIRRAHLAV